MAVKRSTENKKEIEYKVLEKVGVISEGKKNSLELRYVSWNGREPKYDIRSWYTDEEGNERMNKGITLTGEELLKLAEIVNAMESEG